MCYYCCFYFIFLFFFFSVTVPLAQLLVLNIQWVYFSALICLTKKSHSEVGPAVDQLIIVYLNISDLFIRATNKECFFALLFLNVSSEEGGFPFFFFFFTTPESDALVCHEITSCLLSSDPAGGKVQFDV